jgi:hypothetical protein
LLFSCVYALLGCNRYLPPGNLIGSSNNNCLNGGGKEWAFFLFKKWQNFNADRHAKMNGLELYRFCIIRLKSYPVHNHGKTSNGYCLGALTKIILTQDGKMGRGGL